MTILGSRQVQITLLAAGGKGKQHAKGEKSCTQHVDIPIPIYSKGYGPYGKTWLQSIAVLTAAGMILALLLIK